MDWIHLVQHCTTGRQHDTEPAAIKCRGILECIRFLRRSLLLQVEVDRFQSYTIMSQTRIWMVTSQRCSFIHHRAIHWHKKRIRNRSASYLIYKGHCNQIKRFLNTDTFWGKQACGEGFICSIVLSFNAVMNVKNALKELAQWMAHIKQCIIYRSSVREMSTTEGSRIIYQAQVG